MKHPDSKIVQEAWEITKAALSENVFNHSLRTYHLGDNYGEKNKLNYSKEELMLVSLFHDIGLYPEYQKKGKSFQISSSLALKEFLLHEKNISKERINAMMEAIDFHCQFKPRWDKGEVAGLIQVGAHMDVLGIKKSSLEKNVIKSVNDMYPKNNFFLEFNFSFLKTLKSYKAVTGVLLPHTCQDENHYCSL